ncbi:MULTISPECIES: PspC domain-containing protein [unclassified Rathayibacter]|uniref:PspC domain-containing protein n=1 Tax=unclassified Rathayibacter TaxID=2609250 RepID=UPI00188A88D2|nr:MULTISPECIES: PspC domain-containing protein [unclassified Rathayibacter]MBF4461017.1 PspC domain-containing protein [Rathayibacter sp. VKM Ac-2879]MBF4502428.1 PspC domain-containing protein [Rathayibacter sp. VKM Ac-2878]
MTATSTPEAADPGPSTPDPSDTGPADPNRAAAPENRFLLWLRSLDLSRRPGWIGGVCAGVAERLGIDPLIVRGVFVVVAVLGGPAFLFYAAAWLLLPDDEGILPIEQLLRRRLDRVHAGIGVLVLASMLPVAQGFWSLGGAFTGAAPWVPATGRALWTAVVLGLIVVFVVWIARRAGRAERTPPPGQSPATDAASGGTPSSAAPLLPPQRPTELRPTSPEELTVWRERQETWKAEREAFRAQEIATARATAQARAEEARARAHAITAARLERRRLRREANPRLRAGATLLALGASALAGALVSLTASGSTSVVVGFSVATLVLAVAIVAAGVLRRRAILLIAVSVVTVLTASTASLLPPDRQLLPPGGSSTLSSASPGNYAMLAGTLQITVNPKQGGSLDVWQGGGHITITAQKGAAVRVESTMANGSIWVIRHTPNGDVAEEPQGVVYSRDSTSWSQTFGTPDAEPFVVRVAQGHGSIGVYDTSGADTTTDSTPRGADVRTTRSTAETPISTEAGR